MLKRDGRDAQARETSRADWLAELQKKFEKDEF